MGGPGCLHRSLTTWRRKASRARCCTRDFQSYHSDSESEFLSNSGFDTSPSESNLGCQSNYSE